MEERAETSNGDGALAAAFDFIPQGLALFDANLHLLRANSRYRDLLALPEIIMRAGTPLYDIALFLGRRGDLGPGDAIVLAAQRVQSLTEAPTTTTKRRGASGQTLEFQSVRQPDGGLVLSVLDVSARIEAEAALEKMNQSLERRVEERTAALTRVNIELEQARSKADLANRDKTRFLAAASHDLLQPLNAARLYTSTMIERAGGTPVGELARSIEASLSAVEEIMSALLDISRIDSGALKPTPTTFRLRDLMAKAQVEFGPLARERGVRLKILPSSKSVTTDRALAGRIVQNLVSNAIKYTRPGGRVLIGCRTRGTRIRIDVIDTGIGFNKDQHALIFAEFSRLEHGARMAQGLGLGLSIVRRLVSALGLTLELDSVEGRGSRFSLYLPRAREKPGIVDGDAQPREQVSNIAGLKVLCVDNERSILDAMEGLLTGWGCDVRSARSLRDIDRDGLLLGWLPDLVLMDYHLDQTSGLDAIEWLRHNVGGHLPAALVTADRSPQVRQIAEERAIPIVTKPVKPAALRAIISGLAGQRPRQPGSRTAESRASN
ncbi:Signal transduction histidine kinase [Devosia enhydra]|uniref:histidine kinase n=1 Tax=Devosia enhydra TaxID=665118 RepID=A0A1K2I1Q1_9HYPH|nr:ATP-binding protein [Devosia enhydra]SFZ86257.1 Signal transduction histidine kinase [Devosia enhydra]